MLRKLPVIAVNGIIDAQLSPLDRGFMYGDGVFETCRLANSAIPLWNFHRERLLKSCAKLSIQIDINLLESQLSNLISELDLSAATLKITVTRGESGRGYALPDNATPTIVIAAFPSHQYPSAYATEGVRVRVCHQRLSCNSSLAGMKHLNRLEQVLARSEWRDEAIAEGIMLSSRDAVIEGVFSNLFLVKDGQLFTPDLSEAGVEGVMRRYILDVAAIQSGVNVTVLALSLSDVLVADEIFMCNSNYGIWPVREIVYEKNYAFSLGPIALQLQQQINNSLFS